jgi:hypothetical protein
VSAFLRPRTSRHRGGHAIEEIRFTHRIREVAVEYLERGLGAHGAMHEVLAAIREMDRRREGQQRRSR